MPYKKGTATVWCRFFFWCCEVCIYLYHTTICKVTLGKEGIVNHDYDMFGWRTTGWLASPIFLCFILDT